MKVFTNITNFVSDLPVILTIGMFDGVHFGHQKILGDVQELAQSIGGVSALMSFSPHPRLVLQKDSDLKLLTIEEEKVEKLERIGLDLYIRHPFDLNFSRKNSTEFVRDFLVKHINMSHLVVGYDHQFGRNREGGFAQLNELADLYGFRLQKTLEVQNFNQKISSTKVRNALLSGDLAFVKNALVGNYSLIGKVIHGKKIGRTMGFPTANLETNRYKLIPKNGVYAVRVTTQDQRCFNGMMNIGENPTLELGEEKNLEVHIFDFNDDVYDQNLKVELVEFIRGELKFNGLQGLKLQLSEDERVIREKLGGNQ